MIRSIIYSVFSVLVLSIFPSCSSKTTVSATADKSQSFSLSKIFSPDKAETLTLPPADYMLYCENEASGLKATRQLGDFIFSAFYQPLNYLTVKELINGDSLNKPTFARKMEEYGDLTYFAFKIQNTKHQTELMKINLRDEREYYSRLEYMSFGMQHDFKLILDKDTLPCSLFHFERVYDLAPFASFVLAFPKVPAGRELKLWYHDKVFNTGIVVLNFEKESLFNLPTLDI